MDFDSDKDWKAWGKRDPLWAVATWPGKEAGGKDPWTDEAFYAAGAAEWQAISKQWTRYGRQPEACVEIGCGAGRLTRRIAADFQRVEACDISEAMLDYARARIQQPSIRFHLSRGSSIPLEDRSVTGVFSTFVFQHFDSLDAGRAMFAEAARVLSPAGTLFIQLPIHSWPFFARPGLALLHQVRERAEQLYAVVRRRLPLQPTMRGLSYPADWFFRALPELGFTDVELCWFDTGKPGAPWLMSAVLARKR